MSMQKSTYPSSSQPNWTAGQLVLFRLVFLYFTLQVLPLDWKYYHHVFSVNWFDIRLNDIFNISRYTPQFFSGAYTPDHWGLATFADWGIIFLIAVAGTIVWTVTDKKNNQYHRLYYILRVMVRYRLAVAVLAYGFIKLYPMQAPYPSISNLNTTYGDFTSWKMFSLSLGIVPGYQSFLGAVEVTAGLLLLFRRTATIGASIIIFFTGNVFMSNLAYEGGETAYSLFLVTLALFLVAYHAQRIISLIFLRNPTPPELYQPLAITSRQKMLRLAIKSLFLYFFVLLYGFKAGEVYRQGGYQYPAKPGLAGTEGLYHVSKFVINNREIPYSATDTLRWQNVVFEKWATISIKTNAQIKPICIATEEIKPQNENRLYELNGSAGRRYYSYTADTAKQIILLKNEHPGQTPEFINVQYSFAGPSQLILKGLISSKDSVYVVLDKVNKKYLLKEAENGRPQKLKL